MPVTCPRACVAAPFTLPLIFAHNFIAFFHFGVKRSPLQNRFILQRASCFTLYVQEFHNDFLLDPATVDPAAGCLRRAPAFHSYRKSHPGFSRPCCQSAWPCGSGRSSPGGSIAINCLRLNEIFPCPKDHIHQDHNNPVTVIAAQNPILIPNSSVLPNKFIHIVFQLIVISCTLPPVTATPQNDAHRLS